MAALSYLLLPISGLIALALGSEARTRFHGLQAIVFGLVWALALYVGAATSPSVTKIVFVAGAIGWAVLLLSTAAGKDPSLPGVGSLLRATAEDDLRDEP